MEHSVIATSFADPEDIKRYKECRAKGGSEEECLKVGDNGIGCWEDDTTVDIPMCALPPEDWKHFGDEARGKHVLVRTVVDGIPYHTVCELRDTMPHKRNIHNGAGIDLNPAACKELGLTPPVSHRVIWSWV